MAKSSSANAHAISQQSRGTFPRVRYGFPTAEDTPTRSSSREFRQELGQQLVGPTILWSDSKTAVDPAFENASFPDVEIK